MLCSAGKSHRETSANRGIFPSRDGKFKNCVKDIGTKASGKRCYARNRQQTSIMKSCLRYFSAGLPMVTITSWHLTDMENPVITHSEIILARQRNIIFLYTYEIINNFLFISILCLFFYIFTQESVKANF